MTTPTPSKKLTARECERLKPAVTTYAVADGDVAGLQLVVHPSGRMVWSLRYRVGRHQRRLTLGRYPALQLVAARQRANRELRQVDAGTDPATAKHASRDALTFAALAADYVKLAKKTKASWEQDERYLTEAMDAGWRHRRVKDIRRADIIALVEAKAEVAPISANRMQSALSTCFSRAVSLEVIEANPCWRLSKRSEQSRERELTSDEMRTLWQYCVTNDSPITRMLRMLLCTAQRSGEVGDMRWTDIELPPGWQTAAITGAWWTIAKTKRGNVHRVWLNALALDILREAKRATPDSPWVFASTVRPTTNIGARSKKTMAELSRVLTFSTPATRHDLRRTAATLMRAHGVTRTDVAMVLNHALREGGSVTGAYDRYEGATEKQRALTVLGAALAAIVPRAVSA